MIGRIFHKNKNELKVNHLYIFEFGQTFLFKGATYTMMILSMKMVLLMMKMVLLTMVQMKQKYSFFYKS